MSNIKLYEPFVSSNRNKKYDVWVKDKNGKPKKISFGARDYQHYYDKIGYYSSKNHLDPNRKRLYYLRHGETNDKNSARYWANKILW